MNRINEPSPTGYAQRVIATTALAWHVAPASPRAVARRAPHGYVPRRIMRRIQAAASRPGLAHSW
jgi:hypothetical protein